jgi:hypothetical protein
MYSSTPDVLESQKPIDLLDRRNRAILIFTSQFHHGRYLYTVKIWVNEPHEGRVNGVNSGRGEVRTKYMPRARVYYMRESANAEADKNMLQKYLLPVVMYS